MNPQPVLSLTPVVGPSAIGAAVDRWDADMERRNRTPKSRALFRRRIEMCLAFNGWTDPAQITYLGASDWLAYQVKERGWSGSTHDQTISALQGFTRFLVKTDALPTDPWKALERRGEVGKVGGRALTLAEVRAMVAVGYAASAVDRRCKAPRGLFYAFLALTGLRYAEGQACRWGDLDRAGDPPALYTDPKWTGNKAGRRDRVPLCGQLRERLEEWSRCVPSGVADPVFPHTPNRATFAKDRAAAGVPELDGRQRPVGFHSLRRGFASLLYAAKAPEATITRLMRHALGITQARYIDPDCTLEVEAVESIPQIFPQVSGRPQVSASQTVQRAEDERAVKKVPSLIADVEKSRYGVPATFESNGTTESAPVSTVERRTSSPLAPGADFAVPLATASEHQASAARRGRSSDQPRDGNASRLGQRMPRGTPQMDRVLNLLAEAHAGLVAIAGRLGQAEVCDGGECDEG